MRNTDHQRPRAYTFCFLPQSCLAIPLPLPLPLPVRLPFAHHPQHRFGTLDILVPLLHLDVNNFFGVLAQLIAHWQVCVRTNNFCLRPLISSSAAVLPFSCSSKAFESFARVSCCASSSILAPLIEAPGVAC